MSMDLSLWLVILLTMAIFIRGPETPEFLQSHAIITTFTLCNAPDISPGILFPIDGANVTKAWYTIAHIRLIGRPPSTYVYEPCVDSPCCVIFGIRWLPVIWTISVCLALGIVITALLRF
jgi:hypothetical protein